jgi:hypothetical protein
MSTRKKQEEKVPNQPFKFADADLLMQNATILANTDTGREQAYMATWKNDKYMPAYSLGEAVGRRLTYIASDTPTSNGRIPNWIAACRDPEMMKLYTDLWNSGNKFHIMMGQVHGLQNRVATQVEMKQTWEQVFDYFIRNTGIKTPIMPSYVSSNGAAPIIRRFMLGEGCEASTMVSKTVKEGEFKNAVYMASRYFLAYCPKHPNSQPLREFMSQWIDNNFERDHAVIPLATLVFKSGDSALIKAHWLNNAPMDASMFQLWVDKSLDAEDSKHPIRTQYVRAIRNPLRKLGIEVVVKEDLYRECFKSMVVPKFKTTKEEREWADGKMEQILNEERRRHGVTRTPAEPAMAVVMEGENHPF